MTPNASVHLHILSFLLLVPALGEIQTHVEITTRASPSTTWTWIQTEITLFFSSTLDALWVEAIIFAIASLAFLLCRSSPAATRSKGHKLDAKLPRLVELRAAPSARAATYPQKKSAEEGSNLSEQAQAAKYAKAIINASREGDLPTAKTVFRSLQADKKVPMTSLVLNCIMDACVQCGDMAAAIAHFVDAKRLKLADVVTYNTIMKGYLAQGNADKVRRLLLEMHQRGLQPTYVAYHCLLNALVVQGDKNALWCAVREMSLADLQPNAVTCSILFKTITASSSSAELDHLLKMMDSLDGGTDEVLFASMVEACIRVGRLDILSEQTKSYSCAGKLANVGAPIYGSMIKAYGQARDLERIWQLWAEMQDRRVVPTAITLGCLVEALVVNKEVDAAWQVVQQVWLDEETRQAVNTIVYSTLLKGYALSKQYKRVAEIYKEMVERGIPRNTITYNTMLNAMARSGLVHRVPAILQDMRASKVDFDTVTYSTVVKAYCSAGELDNALALLDEMKQDARVVPDEVTYNSLLDGCAKQRRLHDALWLLEEMRASDVKPSNYTLSIVLKLLGRAGKLNEAFQMVEKMPLEFHFRPNIQVYTCLIQACFHNKQLQQALDVHDQIVRDGYTLDKKVYTVLATGCLRAGALNKAEEVVRCAYQLVGHSLEQSRGSPAGVEMTCLYEVVDALGWPTFWQQQDAVRSLQEFRR